MTNQKIPLGINDHERLMMLERQRSRDEVVRLVESSTGRIAVESAASAEATETSESDNEARPNTALFAGVVQPEQFRPY